MCKSIFVLRAENQPDRWVIVVYAQIDRDGLGNPRRRLASLLGQEGEVGQAHMLDILTQDAALKLLSEVRRHSPDYSSSTMRCPISHHATVMAALTKRTANSLAWSTIFDTSSNTA